MCFVKPGHCGGKPHIAGHRIKVQHVAVWHERMGMTPPEIAATYPSLSLPAVYAALAYYHGHRAEIDAAIAADEEFVIQMKQKAGPSKLQQRLAEVHAKDDSPPPGPILSVRIGLASRQSRMVKYNDPFLRHAMLTKNTTSEAAIFGRVVLTRRRELTAEVANYLLQMGFSDEDRVRMHELALRNQEGDLTPEEREELENYVRVGDLLALLKAKVRVALKKTSA